MPNPDKSMLVNCERAKWAMLRQVEDLFEEHGYVEFTWHTGKQRTLTQNAAMHKYFELLADALNDAGLDQRKVFEAMKEGVEIPWSEVAVKDSLWRKIQFAIFRKESTTELERPEVSRVYDTLNRWLSENFGISVPFPKKLDVYQAEDQRKRA